MVKKLCCWLLLLSFSAQALVFSEPTASPERLSTPIFKNLKTLIADLRSRVAASKFELSAIRGSLGVSGQQIADLQKDLDSLKSELTDYENQLLASDERLQTLSTDLQTSIADLTASKKDLADSQQALTNLKSYVERLESENTVLKTVVIVLSLAAAGALTFSILKN